ncbi:hypothetical protein LBMAG56_42500 [Verrucomicrobiota bacterium]|nr:hypothetical protein LBMAG56_42500 [Verrucomicrobiota bacterium]
MSKLSWKKRLCSRRREEANGARPDRKCQLPAGGRLRAMPSAVAQTSKSAVSQVSKPAGRPVTRNATAFARARIPAAPADLEIADRTGLETRATAFARFRGALGTDAPYRMPVLPRRGVSSCTRSRRAP